MKDENKCFFSISLENGITITGENPNEVHHFLHDMHDAFFELAEHYRENNYKSLEEESGEIFDMISNALNTLHNHLNN